MAIVCLNEQAGIGERCITRNNFGLINAAFLAVPGFQFDTASDFADETKWLEAIRDGNLYPVQDILEFEDTTTDDIKYTTPRGFNYKMADGIRSYTLRLNVDLESHKVLRSYSSKNWSIFKADVNKNTKGTSADGTIVKGINLAYFEVGMMKDATADAPAWTSIEVQESDVEEWDTDGVYLNNPTFLPTQLKGVGTIVLAQVGTITTNVFTVTANYVDDSKLDGANSGADTSDAISGALLANFEVNDGSAIITPDSVTESTTTAGEYEIDCTTATISSGTCQFIPSTTLLYKSQVLTLA